MNEAAALNDTGLSPEERLGILRRIAAAAPPRAHIVGQSNNHIHTCYSFSPYTPSGAAFEAWKAGLMIAGSVDHDSMAGAAEMRTACSMLGMGSVTGFELRVFLHGKEEKGASAAGGAASAAAVGRIQPSFFAERKINNPDSAGIIYMTVQGVPSGALPAVNAFLAPVRERRMRRIADMAERANRILAGAGLARIDFERDAAGRSMYRQGGTITERHLLAAIAGSLISSLGRGEALIHGIESKLGLRPRASLRAALAEGSNPHLLYDLLGVLKSEFLPAFFIQPSDECPTAREAVELAASIGAVPAYPYLGDVGESPTGDKRAEKFEDAFLPELFAELKALGFLAVAYMPPRNSVRQLERIQALCREFGFMEISGVDINQARQSFNCPELGSAEFSHLNESAWALAAHEALASLDSSLGLFSASNPLAALPLGERIARYAEAGRKLVSEGLDAGALAGNPADLFFEGGQAT